jgi:hypothetical protein
VSFTWRLALVGLVAAVAAAIGVPAHATYGARVTADEPQYLLTALSLADDGDLDVSDEIAAGRYRAFHAVDLDRQTARLADGRELSPHDPLLPLLLALPMGVGGWVAAKATIVAMATALAVLTAWTAVRRFGIGAGAATWVVAAFAATTPLAPYGSQVYPEVAAALAVVVATATLRARGAGGSALLVLSLVALPWLSVKYVPVAACLAALALWHRRGSPAALAGVAVALVAAGLLYVAVHRRVYGGWTVYATGDHFTEVGEARVVGADPDYVGRARRLAGLLVDRGFGLAAWMPGWLALAPAVGVLARRRPRGFADAVAPASAGWLVAVFVALTMHGWWWPGRQVVVVAPLLVIVIAWAADEVRALRRPLAVAAVIGVATWAWTAFEAATRRRTLVVDFEQTANPWYRLWRLALPDGRGSGLVLDIHTAGWWALLALGVAVGWRVAATARPQPVHRRRAATSPTAGPSSPVFSAPNAK